LFNQKENKMIVNIDQIDLSWQIEWQEEQNEILLELEEENEEIEL
jgi:hypothetical protein